MNDAGIGNVYPKFTPPPSSKNCSISFKKNILGSICGHMENA